MGSASSKKKKEANLAKSREDDKEFVDDAEKLDDINNEPEEGTNTADEKNDSPTENTPGDKYAVKEEAEEVGDSDKKDGDTESQGKESQASSARDAEGVVIDDAGSQDGKEEQAAATEQEETPGIEESADGKADKEDTPAAPAEEGEDAPPPASENENNSNNIEVINLDEQP